MATIAASTPNAYSFARSSRSRGAFLVFCLCLGFIALGLSFAAPWYVFLPVGFAAAECLLRLVRNVPYGLRIDAGGLSVREGARVRDFARADIDHVRVIDWSDSTDIGVVMTDGTSHPLPAMACPASSVLIAELARRNIAVRRG